MNTLTIPDLNLFNTRRMSPTKRDYLYPTIDQIENRSQQHLLPERRYGVRQDAGLYYTGTSNRTLFSQTYYKQIAENYLQHNSKPLPYPIQPYPYLYNIPSYLYPEYNVKQLPLQYETQIPLQDSINTKKLHHHNYVKDEGIPTRQPRIIKQPYLEATFRERRVERQQQKNVYKKEGQKNDKIIDKLKTNQSKDEQQSQIGPINNLIISSKHEASIQTDPRPQPISHSIQTSRSQYLNQRKSSKASVQRILQQQKQLLQSMKMQFQRESDLRFHVQDLQTTKNDLMDRSRELLGRLNELADDKREFGFVFKAFNADHKKRNVFGALSE